MSLSRLAPPTGHDGLRERACDGRMDARAGASEAAATARVTQCRTVPSAAAEPECKRCVALRFDRGRAGGREVRSVGRAAMEPSHPGTGARRRGSHGRSRSSSSSASDGWSLASGGWHGAGAPALGRNRSSWSAAPATVWRVRVASRGVAPGAAVWSRRSEVGYRVRGRSSDWRARRMLVSLLGREPPSRRTPVGGGGPRAQLEQEPQRQIHRLDQIHRGCDLLSLRSRGASRTSTTKPDASKAPLTTAGVTSPVDGMRFRVAARQ
jgi:hypothetical protein